LKIPDGLKAYLDEEPARQEINKPNIITFVVITFRNPYKILLLFHSRNQAEMLGRRRAVVGDICGEVSNIEEKLSLNFYPKMVPQALKLNTNKS